MFPIGPGSFFAIFTLEAIQLAEFHLEMMGTEFNKMQDFAKATPFNPNGSGEFDNDDLADEGNVAIAIRRQVSLEGGVSRDFLRSTIRLWGGMLLSTEGFFEGPPVEATDVDDEG